MTRLFVPDREWYERRLSGFGASEAGPLLGVSRWQTPRSVVEAKGRRIIPDPDAPQRIRLRMGRDMEPILLEHLWETLVERDGDAPRPRQAHRLHRMPGYDFVIANPDGFIGDAMVELKTDEYGQQPWGPEDGPPARVIPPTYYAQVQHGMAATRKERAIVFVQVGFSRQLLYEVPRDAAYVEDLIEYEAGWWVKVLAIRDRLANDPDAPIDDLLPALEGTELTEHLKREHPRSTEVIRSVVTPEQEATIRALREARAARREAEAAEDRAVALVQALIGDAAGISGTDGTITWRGGDDRRTVAWEEVARTYQRAVATIGEAIGPAGIEELAAHHPELAIALAPGDAVADLLTTVTPGARRFVVPRSWDR